MKAITRRQFVTMTSAATGACLALPVLARTAYAKVEKAAGGLQAYLTNRLSSIYKHDKEMKIRKSQDNPAVKQLYKEFLDHPNSHMAHRLLHTRYTDRSASVKALKERGVKLNFYPDN